MLIPENPCKCGEPLCDKTHFVQYSLGIQPHQKIDLQTAQDAMDAMRQAAVSILAACDDEMAELWFQDIRDNVQERRANIASRTN